MKKELFYPLVRMDDGNPHTIEVLGESINESVFIYHSVMGSEWDVVDKKSGLSICHGKTKKKALERFSELEETYLNYIACNSHYLEQMRRYNEIFVSEGVKLK